MDPDGSSLSEIAPGEEREGGLSVTFQMIRSSAGSVEAGS